MDTGFSYNHGYREQNLCRYKENLDPILLGSHMKLINELRSKLMRMTDLNVSEVGKYEWEHMEAEFHNELMENTADEWSMCERYHPSQPKNIMKSRYNSGEQGNIEYDHIDGWDTMCFWFVYDENDTKIKIWAFRGDLGSIVRLINEIGWINSTICDAKKNKWITQYQDSIFYCGKTSD